LVGTNGSGKSSLSLVLASKQLPGFPQNLGVVYLSSNPNDEAYGVGSDHDGKNNDDDTKKAISDMTCSEFLQSRVDQRVATFEHEIEELENKMEENPENIQVVERLSELYDLTDTLRDKAAREIQSILEDELSFGPHLHKTLSQLSSGWRYKCHLASALLVHADVIIVDEPSFLDHKSTQWLVHRLQRASKQEHAMVLLVSHKEVLLDQLCQEHILYINAANKTLTQYNTGYSAFRELHAAQVAASQKTLHQAQERVTGADKALQKVKHQLNKHEKDLKQQTTKNADQRFIKGKSKEHKQKADKSAASKLKQLKKHQATIQETAQQQSMTDRVKPIKITGNVASSTLAMLEDVSVSFDESHNGYKVFSNVELRLEPTDRVLLAGPNGCGKSTLIKLLLGDLEKEAVGVVIDGNVRLNPTLQHKSLYFPQTALQDLTRHCGSQSALSYLQQREVADTSTASPMTETRLRQHLGDFGLTRSVALRRISTLSAGQQVRLWLASKLLHQSQPCLLILDEISENVDVETRLSLIDLLNSTFQGAVLIVSHDDDFCRTFRPNQIWNLSSQGIQIEYPP